MRGRVSELVSEAGVAAFRAAAPSAGFVDVAGAGHMVAGDRNDAFTDAILAFLGDAFAKRLPLPRRWARGPWGRPPADPPGPAPADPA